MNTLYYGDCLTIMRERMADESVCFAIPRPVGRSEPGYETDLFSRGAE